MSDWKTEVRIFLKIAESRIDSYPDKMTFKPHEGRLVIGWMRALIDQNLVETEGEKR